MRMIADMPSTFRRLLLTDVVQLVRAAPFVFPVLHADTFVWCVSTVVSTRDNVSLVVKGAYSNPGGFSYARFTIVWRDCNLSSAGTSSRF